MNEWMNEWKIYYLKLKETFINDNSGNCGKSAKGYLHDVKCTWFNTTV